MTVDENELTKNKLNQKFLVTFSLLIVDGIRLQKQQKIKTQYFDNFHPKSRDGPLKISNLDKIIIFKKMKNGIIKE